MQLFTSNGASYECKMLIFDRDFKQYIPMSKTKPNLEAVIGILMWIYFLFNYIILLNKTIGHPLLGWSLPDIVNAGDRKTQPGLSFYARINSSINNQTCGVLLFFPFLSKKHICLILSKVQSGVDRIWIVSNVTSWLKTEIKRRGSCKITVCQIFCMFCKYIRYTEFLKEK